MLSAPAYYRPRDVPVSCPCRWRWYDQLGRWTRTGWHEGCPWHTRPPAASEYDAATQRRAELARRVA